MILSVFSNFTPSPKTISNSHSLAYPCSSGFLGTIVAPSPKLWVLSLKLISSIVKESTLSGLLKDTFNVSLTFKPLFIYLL